MSIPSWTFPSNSNLGTFDERTSVSINVLVFDTEDRSTIETQQFENRVDSTILPNYGENAYFWVESNGLSQTGFLGQPDRFNRYLPRAQNYVFKFPRAAYNIYGNVRIVEERKPGNTYKTDGFFGIAIDGVPFKSPNSGRVATIGQGRYTENDALYPVQAYQEDSTDPWGPFADGSGVIQSDRKFYYHTDPRFLYEKDATKHSPIIGYAFDGNPIYGPYGYKRTYQGVYSNNALYTTHAIVKKNNTDDIFYVALQNHSNKPLTNTTYWRLATPTEPFQVMRSSYRLTVDQRTNGTIPDGTYIEDYEYIEGLGDLDQYNGIGGENSPYRSPEYPGGTYAYFVTVDPDDLYLPRYPYILGPTYYQEPLLPNGNLKFPGDISLEVISGQIPPGLRIEGLKIVGTPFEVANKKTFRFVLRANNADGLSDRTYSITIEGADEPIWLTPPGDLAIGATGYRTETVSKILDVNASQGDNTIKMTSISRIVKQSLVTAPKGYSSAVESGTKVIDINPSSKILTLNKPILDDIPFGKSFSFSYTYEKTNLFVLDNDFVNYQLSAIDADLPTGQKLTFFIPPRGGELPPGLTLSADGIISGFTEALLAKDQGDINGAYDMHLYDKFGYDYGVRPYNGFDSFLFDNQTFDFSDTTRIPRKLNRYYQFRVRVTDGMFYTDRVFRIYVIGDDYFRADNTLLQVGTGIYTVDTTPIRKPIWITPAYLGKRRANNYITTYLDVFESATLRGSLGYILDPTNNDGTVSQLPPGMILDQITGEIYGDVPYQPAVTKQYKFTVRAIRYDPENAAYGTTKATLGINNTGSYNLKLDSVLNLRKDSLVNAPNASGYIIPGTIVTAIDVGTKTVTLNTPLLKTVPAGERFIFSYVVSSAKTFTLDIMGEVDSTIRFITEGDLGSIPANFISDLSVEATTTVKDAVLSYTLVGGKLPPGLTLVNDGTIQGKVNQYATIDDPGLTTFDNNTTKFDNFNTSIDREFTFIVLAQDQFLYSAVTKIFTVKVTTPNNLLYSNIYVKPFLKNTKRLELVEFFTNPDIFERNLIYRASDPSFGVQKELKMLIYAGIETKDGNEYAAALGRSSKKRYRFGSVKKAFAKIPGTNDIMYEVIYLDILDDREVPADSKFISEPSQAFFNNIKTIDIQYLNHPISIHQNSRDLWDGDKVTKTLTTETVPAGSVIIPVDSFNEVKIKDLITSENNNYFRRDTFITSTNKLLGTITISKPLLEEMPLGTRLRTDTDIIPRTWLQDKVMTADFGGQLVSDSNKSNVFKNNTTNIRSNIQALGDTERNFLPLWMRTPQSFSGIAQGFQKAVVLCYVKPGYSDRIINNIKNLGIDFKNIDFTVDRVIIDSVAGESGDKYIAFAAREIING